MSRNWLLPTLIAVAAIAFAAGVLFASPREAFAENSVSQTLPPIFEVGNTVTFGPQGPNLTIVQVYGDWIYVEQQRMGGFSSPMDSNTDNSQRFWVCAPHVQDSWRLVRRATAQ